MLLFRQWPCFLFLLKILFTELPTRIVCTSLCHVPNALCLLKNKIRSSKKSASKFVFVLFGESFSYLISVNKANKSRFYKLGISYDCCKETAIRQRKKKKCEGLKSREKAKAKRFFSVSLPALILFNHCIAARTRFSMCLRPRLRQKKK